MTGYLSDEVRAVILSALMVLSVFGGTVAFSGTAAAASAGTNDSVVPGTVDEQSTNTFTVTADVDTADTDDGIDQRIQVNFPSQLTLSGDSTVENIQVTDDKAADDTIIVGSNSTTPSNDSATVVLEDNGSSTTTSVDTDLTIEFDVTNVDATSVAGDEGTSITSGPVNYAFDAVDDGATLDGSGADIDGKQVGTVAINNNDVIIDNTDTIFQGQEGIEFDTGDTSLTGNGGDAEGRVISSPISPTAVPGQYSDTGNADSNAIQVTLDEPRISDYEIRNANDEDISGGSVAEANADNLEVFVEYNFDQYENAEISVDDQDGLEITDDVITTTNPAGGTATGTTTQTFGLNLDGQDAGTYTITAEGEDDFDFGQASQSATLELTSEENVGVELASDTVTQGDNLRYDVVGGVAGDSHIVQINDTDFNDNADDFDIGTIFRNVEDVEERGIVVGNNFHEVSGTATSPSFEGAGSSVSVNSIDAAYAVVTIDDDTGLGVGSLDSTALDDTSVTIEVSDSISGTSPGDLGDNSGGPETISVSGDRITDDADFDVEEGTLTLDSPGQTYVVGSEVDVNGTASTGIDDVAIYVRDEDQFELVGIGGSSTVSVDADGSFEETDIVFSANSEILRLPGSYRVGIIDADDANLDSTEGNNIDGISTGSAIDQKITTSDFNSETSDQRSIRVIGQSLSAEFTSPVNGQIALEQDGANVEVSGSAPGSEDVLLIAVGPRGNIVAQQVGVETDQTFEEDSFDITDLNKGAASLHVYSIGRDDRVGDNDLPDSFAADSLGEFQRFLTEVNANTRQSLQEQDLTGDQVRSSILAQTVEDDATDDALVNANVRLVDSQSRIVNVYQEGNEASGLNPVAAGETMIVEVQTNLKSDDNTISLEVQNEDVTVGLAAVDEWGDDGRATLTLDTEDAATGTYSVEIDDGHNSVTEEIELVEEVSTATPTPTEADDTPTATASPTPTATASPTATAAPDTDTPTPTEGGGPGFGAVVALVALLAAALLATRRDN
jgi:major cell surface glycoprotein (TIGR04216 family)